MSADPAACTSCKRWDSFVTDNAAGDVVCTACGLVATERLIDERPSYGDVHRLLFVPVRTEFLDRRVSDVAGAREQLLEQLHRRPCPGVTVQVVDRGLALYSNFLDALPERQTTVRGDSRGRILVAAVYHAAVLERVDVDPRQFSHAFELPTVEVCRGLNTLSQVLPADSVKSVYVPDVPSLVLTYAMGMSFDADTKRAALAMAGRVQDVRSTRAFRSWRPNSLAAGVVWNAIADGVVYTQRLAKQDEVAALTNVSKTTFISVHKQIKARLATSYNRPSSIISAAHIPKASSRSNHSTRPLSSASFRYEGSGHVFSTQ